MSNGERTTRRRKVHARKPAGGFRLVKAEELMRVWWSYRSGKIQFRDVRVYLAAHEMDARRCRLKAPRRPLFTLLELKRLVGGVGGEHLRASLRRLEACGCLSWSASEISFGGGSPPGGGTEGGGEEVMNGLTGCRNRRVPVPRTALRLMASTGRPVLAATVLGHLLRCLFTRRGGCVSGGACSSSWVAEVFGVDPRNVKAARAALCASGWLEVVQTDHWHRQRFGGWAIINLAWRPRRSASTVTESPPRSRFSTTKSPPPDSHMKLPSESTNQKPGRAGPAGARVRSGGKPSLRNIRPADLTDTGRLLELYRDAVERGFVSRGESGRLLFATAAEHALRVSMRNPCGLFNAVLRRGLWSYCSNEDEVRAIRRLRQAQDVPSRRSLQQPAPPGAQVQRSPGAMERLGATLSKVVLPVLLRGGEGGGARVSAEPRGGTPGALPVCSGTVAQSRCSSFSAASREQAPSRRSPRGLPTEARNAFSGVFSGTAAGRDVGRAAACQAAHDIFQGVFPRAG